MAAAAFQSPMPLSGSSQQAGLETAFQEHHSLGYNILCLHLLAQLYKRIHFTHFGGFFLSLDSSPVFKV